MEEVMEEAAEEEVMEEEEEVTVAGAVVADLEVAAVGDLEEVSIRRNLKM